MSRKDKVRSALEEFISRVAKGEGSPEEISALPNVADTYLKHYAAKREDEDLEASVPKAPGIVHMVVPPFPTSGYVSADQIATFLGCKPATIWKKLRVGESCFPKPKERQGKCTRWEASEIWEYRERQQVAVA